LLSVKAKESLTVRLISQTEAKAGLSDPTVTVWKGRRAKNKSYSGDNRLIFPKSPYRREGLAPRCRFFATWGSSRSQGLGCSPIKAEHELGSERRETVWSISNISNRILRGFFYNTRGLRRTYHWCTSSYTNGIRWVAMYGVRVPLKASKWETHLKMNIL